MGMTIIYIPVTDAMRIEARRKADEMGELNNSIESGDGNYRGFIGELAVNTLLNGQMVNTYDYDILMGGVKIEVKSKGCVSIPYPHYDASLADFNTKQKCDWYAFTRVLYDDTMVWFCGMDKKMDYIPNSRFMKKGQIDPDNGYPVKADCWNRAYQDIPIPDVIVDKARRMGLQLWLEDEA